MFLHSVVAIAFVLDPTRATISKFTGYRVACVREEDFVSDGTPLTGWNNIPRQDYS